MPAELKIPAIGESITEVQIGEWHKAENDAVTSGEDIVTIESEKASLDLPAPVAGRLVKILKRKGEMAKVGEVIAQIEDAGGETAPAKAKAEEAAPTKPAEATPKPEQKPAPAKPVPKEKERQVESAAPAPPPGRSSEPAPELKESKPAPSATPEPPAPSTGSREEEVVPMSPLRRAAARRLMEAQHNAALLTTFNEADMSAVIALRKELGEAFQKKYTCKLGFMSFFVKAAIDALKHVPQINAEVRGADVVFRNYFDIGIAISSGRGLVVPVLRNAERLSFAEIEVAIASLAQRAGAGKIMPDDLAGGTFTISNGGIFGSLLSTPIVNPPQSGVLGMHTIQERPVALAGQVVIRPMMYLALTYDHRVVDGREAVTFLKHIKNAIETPARMLLEV
jgi:2-oxoglutarate dehydrogenase E2 component (dihydrolipoamide succinyltransferase)